jgi:heme/copper-type cytochrome/quinol oxidase subunit 2
VKPPRWISPDSAVSPVLWFAVLGAPIGWTVQFAVGYWTSEAQCTPGTEQWSIALDTWTIVATAFAAVTAAAAGAAALALYRRTREADDEGPPPAGRTHFLAVVGLAVTPLFLVMIGLTALGVLIHIPCGQS